MPSGSVSIKSGQYKGKKISIQGSDVDVLGKSIFAVKEPIAFDYIKRMVMEAFSPTSKVWIGKLQDGNTIAVSDEELKEKEKEK